jgi:hypothetical protein
MPKKTLQIKKKKKVTLVPKGKKANHTIRWDPSQAEQDVYDEEQANTLDPDEIEFMEGLSAIEEKHFRFYCYRCGQRLKVPVSWAKMGIACGRCERNIIIPPPLEEDL